MRFEVFSDCRAATATVPVPVPVPGGCPVLGIQPLLRLMIMLPSGVVATHSKVAPAKESPTRFACLTVVPPSPIWPEHICQQWWMLFYILRLFIIATWNNKLNNSIAHGTWYTRESAAANFWRKARPKNIISNALAIPKMVNREMGNWKW